MNNPIIKTKNLVKTFEKGQVRALDGINLEIQRGEFISIVGPSGSGKSTLLHMIGALDLPTSGEVIVDGINLAKNKKLEEVRSKKIGFVFQLHNLIPTLNSLENVLIPTFETKLPRKEKQNKAKRILDSVGLGNRTNTIPTKLSGGERQRVAIARALINDPIVILADEPTGDLDSKTGQKIIELLKRVNETSNTTLIIVTHDLTIADQAQRKIEIIDGKIL